jgi:hypothetical protein
VADKAEFVVCESTIQIEFQFPNISGRSRQGAPTGAIQSTASRNRRLFAPDRPGSPILPGRSGATRSHCVSFRTNRSKAASHWEALNQGPSPTPPPPRECQQALARRPVPRPRPIPMAGVQYERRCDSEEPDETGPSTYRMTISLNRAPENDPPEGFFSWAMADTVYSAKPV